MRRQVWEWSLGKLSSSGSGWDFSCHLGSFKGDLLKHASIGPIGQSAKKENG